MSTKWDERSVVNFLQAYKQHPCLWNPYHKDYYNCYEKNVALQKIIDDLGTPGFTVTDYLQQIKSVREKYKQEQTRTIKSLQSQKQYKSPFPWYDLVSEMLTKVIDDEEKVRQHNSYSILRSLSSDNIKNAQRQDKMTTEAKLSKIRVCNNATCERISRRSKSVEKASRSSGKNSLTEKNPVKEKSDKRVRYAPCTQYRTRDGRFRDADEDAILTCRPTRDTESEPVEYPVDTGCNGPCSLISSNDKVFELPFLKCPLCGWEEAKFEGVGKGVHSNFVSCSKYDKALSGDAYTLCTDCDKLARGDLSYPLDSSKNYVDNSGDFDILQDPTKQPPRANLITSQPSMESTKTTKKHGDEITKDNVAISFPLQAEVIQGAPVVTNKLKYGTIEASTQLRIILSQLKKDYESSEISKNNDPQNIPLLQDKPEYSVMAAQYSLTDISPEIRKVDLGINTTNNVEKEVQGDIDVTDGTKKSVSTQTLQLVNQKSTGHVKCHSSGPPVSKEVSANIVDQVSEGVQCTICISRANFAGNSSLENVVEAGTAMSKHQISSVGCATMADNKEFKSTCTQCRSDDERVQLLYQEQGVNSIHEPGKYCPPNENLKCPVEAQVGTCAQDLCVLDTLAAILQELLRDLLIKEDRYKTAQADHGHKCQLKGNCFIDATEMLDAIKDCVTKSLKSSVTEDNIKELRRGFEGETLSQEVEAKPDFVDMDTSYDGKLGLAEESIFQPVFQSAIKQRSKRSSFTEAETLPAEKVCKKPSFVDKEVYAYSTYKDVGSNGLVTQIPFRDVETQSNGFAMKDSVCLAKYENETPDRVSVGTQKRDPILVRLIKCAGCQAVVKSDKETVTLGLGTVEREKQYTDRQVAPCGRPTCMAPVISKKLNEINLNDKLANNYCRRSVSFRDDICDKDCRGKLSYDWTDVTNIDILSNITNSKIPLCVRPRKYSLAGSK